MKVKNSCDMKNFFFKCGSNVLKKLSYQENCIHSHRVEKELIKEYRKHEKDLNSLVVDTKIMTENPYFRDINISKVKHKNIICEKMCIPKYVLSNISWIKQDINRELDDYIIKSRLTKNVYVDVLKEDGETWISPTLAEQNTINPSVDKAYGNVLTYGLGMGYFVYMCALKDNVKSITVVERNENIIEVFKNYILPQFKTDVEINIIKGDLFDYWNEEFLNKFDFTFVDIWKDDTDGLEILTKMFEQYNYKGNADYWVEFSCYYMVRGLLMLYFKALAEDDLMDFLSDSHKGNKRNIVKKIHRYFRGIDSTVTDVNTLKDYMYNNNLIRDILSIKI